MGNMASYFSGTKVADYTTTELSVTPQKIMVEDGKKNQIIHEFDDGTISVVELSDIYFDVTLQWSYLVQSDKDIIVDMYYNSSKANGSKNTFYWHHPLEYTIYVARFISNPSIQNEADKPNGFVIPEVQLRIEGVKGAL